MKTDLSIILPCYNEGNIIRQNICKLYKFLDNNTDLTYEIIVVNDGSTDFSKRLLEQLPKWTTKAEHINRINIINYKPNKGKGFAIRKGILHAKGDYVLFMDADFSTSLNEINNFWEHRFDADILIGNRNDSKSNVTNKTIKRKIISKCCNILTRIIVPIGYEDTQCGFKFFRTDIAKQIAKRQRIARFAFDVEYLYIAKLRNYSVKELPVKWNDRRESKIKLSSSSLQFFKDLFKIRKLKMHYKK